MATIFKMPSKKNRKIEKFADLKVLCHTKYLQPHRNGICVREKLERPEKNPQSKDDRQHQTQPHIMQA